MNNNLKAGDTVTCLHDFPPIPGAINFTAPQFGKDYTIKNVGKFFHPEIKGYIDFVTLVELPNNDIKFESGSRYHKIRPGDFTYGAEFFTLKVTA